MTKNIRWPFVVEVEDLTPEVQFHQFWHFLGTLKDCIMLELNWSYCILRFWTKMESSHGNITNHHFPLLFPSWSLGKLFSNLTCFGWLLYMSIPIPLIWGLVGLLEFCIIFVYIHEKSLQLFPAIPIFSTPEKIHSLWSNKCANNWPCYDCK